MSNATNSDFLDVAIDLSMTDGQIVLENRNSGSLSVIDVATDTVALTLDLSQGVGNQTLEPMYLLYLGTTDEVV